MHVPSLPTRFLEAHPRLDMDREPNRALCLLTRRAGPLFPCQTLAPHTSTILANIAGPNSVTNIHVLPNDGVLYQRVAEENGRDCSTLHALGELLLLGAGAG